MNLREQLEILAMRCIDDSTMTLDTLVDEVVKIVEQATRELTSGEWQLDYSDYELLASLIDLFVRPIDDNRASLLQGLILDHLDWQEADRYAQFRALRILRSTLHAARIDGPTEVPPDWAAAVDWFNATITFDRMT